MKMHFFKRTNQNKLNSSKWQTPHRKSGDCIETREQFILGRVEQEKISTLFGGTEKLIICVIKCNGDMSECA